MRVAVVLGSEELTKEAVAVKNLRTGEQQVVDRTSAAEVIRAILGNE